MKTRILGIALCLLAAGSLFAAGNPNLQPLAGSWTCTGIVVTKLDGTAKGGVILSIMRQFDIPVKFVGVGEAADDLIPFDPAAYVDTLFE